MFTLYINTCSSELIVILFKNNKIVTQKIIKDQENFGQFLMPTVKKVLKDIELSNIIVVNGPGSFTGIRIGVTVAKTLAYLKNIDIYTTTTLEEKLFSTSKLRDYISVKEKNGYYVGKINKDTLSVEEYYYFNTKDYNEFKTSNFIMEEVSLNYVKILKQALKRKNVNPHMVNPLYIKKIGVEK